MKFLDNPILQRVSAFLSNCDCGEYYIGGMVEAYTCKGTCHEYAGGYDLVLTRGFVLSGCGW